MKFKIVHECGNRLRIQMLPKKMTMEQADIIETYLKMSNYIKQVTVHEATGCAIIVYSGSRQNVIETVSRFSFKNADIATPEHSIRALNKTYKEKLVSAVSFRILRQLFLPTSLRNMYSVIRAVPYVIKGIKCLLSGKMRVELLDGLSIAISIIRRDYSTAGSVMFLLHLGELLEEWTHKKSVEDLARCMSLNIDKVWLRQGENEISVPLSQVKPGDIISIRVGSVVPLDGVICEGEVMVNQASLTGEAIPVQKRIGTTIYAGTVIEEGECAVRVEQGIGESRYDRIVSMIEQSDRLKSSAEDNASHLADKLVPYTLSAAAVTYILSGNVTRALSVLMVDFSCALKLAMPLAVLSAMREASEYHATVKGGKFLEAVAKADTIVFDKTGTLTHACPVVAEVVSFGGRDESEMLRLAACLEEHFPHSMANAVVQEARIRELYHEEMHTNVEYLVAHGISSTVNGTKVVIGSAHFIFEDLKCRVPERERDKFESLPEKYSHLYMAIGGELAAVICIFDPLRTEAAQAVAALRKMGIKRTVMLTGDSERTAKAIAQEIGVDEYRAEVLPEDKAKFIEEARQNGHTVIMVGDGINDSPALSAANVGIAISDGAAIAREIADITISADDLFELVSLRDISTRLIKRIHSNYRFVIGFNGGLIALGAAGVMPPATSSLLHNISTLGVSLRSMTNLIK